LGSSKNIDEWLNIACWREGSHYRVVIKATLIVLLSVTCAQPQKSDVAAPKSASVEFHPSPEMQKLFDAFVGSWRVSESFEISTSRQGKTRKGTASFRTGAGFSLIEDYNSDGSAGPLSFLALIWWDRQEQIYRFLTCANSDGCAPRGTSRWEGNKFVNSWVEKVDGKSATFKDSFVDISPSSFRLVSEGSADGKTIWRVITKYERVKHGK
jgi:hypothetical protein